MTLAHDQLAAKILASVKARNDKRADLQGAPEAGPFVDVVRRRLRPEGVAEAVVVFTALARRAKAGVLAGQLGSYDSETLEAFHRDVFDAASLLVGLALIKLDDPHGTEGPSWPPAWPEDLPR